MNWLDFTIFVNFVNQNAPWSSTRKYVSISHGKHSTPALHVKKTLSSALSASVSTRTNKSNSCRKKSRRIHSVVYHTGHTHLSVGPLCYRLSYPQYCQYHGVCVVPVHHDEYWPPLPPSGYRLRACSVHQCHCPCCCYCCAQACRVTPLCKPLHWWSVYHCETCMFSPSAWRHPSQVSVAVSYPGPLESCRQWCSTVHPSEHRLSSSWSRSGHPGSRAWISHVAACCHIFVRFGGQSLWQRPPYPACLSELSSPRRPASLHGSLGSQPTVDFFHGTSFQGCLPALLLAIIRIGTRAIPANRWPHRILPACHSRSEDANCMQDMTLLVANRHGLDITVAEATVADRASGLKPCTLTDGQSRSAQSPILMYIEIAQTTVMPN